MPRIERGEEVLKTPIALIAPVKLLVVALQESATGQKLRFVFGCKRHVNRRGVGRVAKPHQTARQRGADLLLIDAVTDQQPRTCRRREGHRDLQFWIVASAGALIGIGPTAVEHVFALRVRFQVAGHDAGDATVDLGHEMPRPPAGADRGRTRFLNGR